MSISAGFPLKKTQGATKFSLKTEPQNDSSKHFLRSDLSFDGRQRERDLSNSFLRDTSFGRNYYPPRNKAEKLSGLLSAFEQEYSKNNLSFDKIGRPALRPRGRPPQKRSIGLGLPGAPLFPMGGPAGAFGGFPGLGYNPYNWNPNQFQFNPYMSMGGFQFPQAPQSNSNPARMGQGGFGNQMNQGETGTSSGEAQDGANPSQVQKGNKPRGRPPMTAAQKAEKAAAAVLNKNKPNNFPADQMNRPFSVGPNMAQNSMSFQNPMNSNSNPIPSFPFGSNSNGFDNAASSKQYVMEFEASSFGIESPGNTSNGSIPSTSPLSSRKSNGMGFPSFGNTSKGNKSRNQAAQAIKQQVPRCSCLFGECLIVNCVCFQSGLPCNYECLCKQCCNIDGHQKRNSALQANNITPIDIKEFYNNLNRLNSQMSQSGNRNLSLDMGCNCKTSNCAKSYCKCFANSAGCSQLCKCATCMNPFPRRFVQPPENQGMDKKGGRRGQAVDADGNLIKRTRGGMTSSMRKLEGAMKKVDRNPKSIIVVEEEDESERDSSQSDSDEKTQKETKNKGSNEPHDQVLIDESGSSSPEKAPDGANQFKWDSGNKRVIGSTENYSIHLEGDENQEKLSKDFQNGPFQAQIEQMGQEAPNWSSSKPDECLNASSENALIQEEGEHDLSEEGGKMILESSLNSNLNCPVAPST